jgi:hypothetical protein
MAVMLYVAVYGQHPAFHMHILIAKTDSCNIQAVYASQFRERLQ